MILSDKTISQMIKDGYSEGRPMKPLIEYWYEEVPETFAKLADREDFQSLLKPN